MLVLNYLLIFQILYILVDINPALAKNIRSLEGQVTAFYLKQKTVSRYLVFVYLIMNLNVSCSILFVF